MSIRRLFLALVALLCPSIALGYPVVTNNGATFFVANDSSTGTVVSELVIYSNSNPAKAIIAPAGTTSGVIGVASQGAGTTGSVLIQQSGFANCVFDGSTVAGDAVVASSTTNGNCHDSGSATLTATSIGQVSSTNSGPGTYTVLLYAAATAAGLTLQPINNLPAQTGNYNAQNFQFTNVNGFNGAIYATDLICDGSTDQAANLQADITSAEAIASTGLGLVFIPARCNGTSGHQLVINSNVTIPKHIFIIGMGGECFPGDPNCVTINYGGSGEAFTTTNTNGSGLQDIRTVNTSSGTNGLDLNGASGFRLYGAGFEGFTTGILIQDSSASSAIYSDFVDSYAYRNGTGMYLLQQNSGKAVNGNQFINFRAVQSTAGENIHMTGIVSENVFQTLDISHGATNPCTGCTGVLVDSNSGRGTFMTGVTAEGLSTVFNLGTNVINFTALTVDGGFFNGTNGAPLATIDPTATYKICWDVLGNMSSECQRSPDYVEKGGYFEPTAIQDPMGWVGIGQIQNLVTKSEALDNAAWTKVNGSAQTIGTGVTAPNGTASANSVTLNGTGPGGTGLAAAKETFSNGSSIQNTCFTLSEWFKVDGSSAGTLPPYWEIRLADGADANAQFMTYPVTMAWQRAIVTNCFAGSTSTSVIPYSVYTTAANNQSAQNGVIIDVWGVQLSKSMGPVPYFKTDSSIIATVQTGLVSPLLAMTPTTVGSLPATCYPGNVRTVSDWNGTPGTCTGSGSNYSPATCGASNTWYCP